MIFEDFRVPIYAVGTGAPLWVRSLATASDDLARELQRVSQSWEKKALPDF